MGTFLQDLRYSLRMLRKNPGFSMVAVFTLALGIGANTAIFSVVNGVLLKPLAYEEPERIVTILHRGTNPVSPADFLDWRNDSHNFEVMAAAESWGGALSLGNRLEEIPGIRFGEGMFDLFGVQPIVGRTFQVDDLRSGNDRVLVIGHSLWQRRFGGDPNVVGQSVTLDGQPYTVIGVMPATFRFTPFWANKAEMAAPLDLTPRATARRGNSLRIFARLKDGVAIEMAQAEMDAICRRLEEAYPDTNTGRTAQVVPLLDQVVGRIQLALLMLAGAVVFVLLIACANVANLLLVRAAARQREIAIRTALGASRWQTIRQLLTESMLLAVVAGAFGLLLGYGSLEWIKGLLTGDSTSGRLRMPRLSEIAMDPSTLLFTLIVAILTGLIFGLAPAWQAARPDLNDAMKESGRGTTVGRGGRRLRNALVIAEISLALITMVGAGLMLRSFSRVTTVDSGFDHRNVLSMVVSLRGEPAVVGEKRDAYYRDLIDRLGALPGVTSASAINHLPIAGDTWGLGVSIEGRPPAPPGEGIVATYRVCKSAYFDTMGIGLLSGRDFTEQDRVDTPGVAIINDQFARAQWAGEDPVGKRITLDDLRNNPKWLTIVGVIKDVKQRNLTDEVSSEIYIPFSQSPYLSSTAGHHSMMTLVMRTDNPMGVAAAAQESVWNLNRNVPVSSVATLEEVIANAVWQPRFNMILIALFAGLALLLGAVGIYGVMAYSVAQRTHEIGIRIALGAGRRDVFALVVGQGMKVASLGLLIGVGGALALTQFLSTLLYQVEPTDPLTFVSVCGLLAAVSFLACWLPALSATRVDPLIALRQE